MRGLTQIATHALVWEGCRLKLHIIVRSLAFMHFRVSGERRLGYTLGVLNMVSLLGAIVW